MTPGSTEPELADVRVASYRGTVEDLQAVLAAVRRVEADRPGLRLQLLDASRVYGADHLLQAALLARRSRARGDPLAEDPAVAVLCRAAATRQIDRALAFLGLSASTTAVAVVALGAKDDEAAETLARALGWSRDDALLEGDAAVLDAFAVPGDLRATVPRERWGDLILERVALLDASW